jgi:hypothetical protein
MRSILRKEVAARGRLAHAVLAVAACVTLVVSTASLASAQTTQDKARARRANSPFNLAAGPTTILQGNLVQCGVDNQGNVCTDVFNSPTGGGGFWPSGTTNQYIFNSGLQVAAINGPAAGPWAGDTVGAYFFDARGTQPHGTARIDSEGGGAVFNSLVPADIENWPAGAFVTDTSIFNAALIGNPTVSDQDSWVTYWDGDPNRISNRDHPMGIQIEQRSLAFNAPRGAEHTIFFIYKFTNVTNDPGFQLPNEQRFGVSLPDAGWEFTNLYIAFSMDPDVTTHATDNFSTAILPFNLGIAYHSTFVTDDFNFAARADLYAPPFFVGPGFVGVKYLRSPVNPATGEEVGLTMFSNTLNQATGFPDPIGVKQLFRYLKGDVNTAAGDNPCNIANAIQSRLCFLAQEAADTRFYQSSGPFSLGPGESSTIVVAYTHGAPVRIADFTPGATLRPGIPARAPGVGAAPARPIERIAGLVSIPPSAVTVVGNDTIIDESRVNVVRGSLLQNAQIAQSIFNNRFLLPRPPEPPRFTLVPGHNQVTVIWEPSRTDQIGDPFFTIASDPASPLYDPNYRQFDVEGYRVYRATGLGGGFELVGQFDKTGTVFEDVTGALDPEFVPEEGDPFDGPVEHPLTGDLVQFPAGARIRDAVTGSVIVLAADTVTLEDTGIPFVFVDRAVRNGITYRYIVTAFDVNSLQSGPSVLESPRQPQNVVPRSTGLAGTQAVASVELRGQSEVLDPSAPLPSIDAQGRFSGPMPPTDGLPAGDLQLALGQAVQPGQINVVRIDSVIPLTYSVQYHLTVGTERVIVGPDELSTVRSGGTTETVTEAIVTIPADTTVLQGLFTNTPKVAGSVPFQLVHGRPPRMSGVADFASANPQFWTQPPPASAGDGGSRWFSGENETAEHPTLGTAVGELPGIDAIYAPQATLNAPAIQRRFAQAMFTIMRAADVEVTWQGGQVTSVHDVTHDLPVPFKAKPQASYGFIPDANGDGVLSLNDTQRLDFQDAFGGWRTGAAVDLVQQPVVGPVDVTGDNAANGTGFGLFLNGEVFYFLGQPPESGTWTLRSYAGVVSRTESGYSFTSSLRPPAIPGLTMVLNVEAPAVLEVSDDLSRVHTVPDPYYVRSAFDLGPSNKTLRFVNLPSQAIIRIFTVNGILVRVLEHNDAIGGGEASWDLRNRNNQFVASGVYFYVIETPTGKKKTGRFTVVQFAR